jgi:hypothetical protein
MTSSEGEGALFNMILFSLLKITYCGISLTLKKLAKDDLRPFKRKKELLKFKTCLNFLLASNHFS